MEVWGNGAATRTAHETCSGNATALRRGGINEEERMKGADTAKRFSRRASGERSGGTVDGLMRIP